MPQCLRHMVEQDHARNQRVSGKVSRQGRVSGIDTNGLLEAVSHDGITGLPRTSCGQCTANCIIIWCRPGWLR